MFIAVFLVAPVWAQKAGNSAETRNLFKTAGQKQTAKDFKPAPDKGKGGKYLFLPPGYKGKEPGGYFVFRSPGYRIWAMMQGFGEVGNGEKAVNWFKQRLKVYPLTTGPRKHTATSTSGNGPTEGFINKTWMLNDFEWVK